MSLPIYIVNVFRLTLISVSCYIRLTYEPLGEVERL